MIPIFLILKKFMHEKTLSIKSHQNHDGEQSEKRVKKLEKKVRK